MNSTCSHHTPTLGQLGGCKDNPKVTEAHKDKGLSLPLWLSIACGTALGVFFNPESRVKGSPRPRPSCLDGREKHVSSCWSRSLPVTASAQNRPRVTCTHTLPSRAKSTQNQGEWGGDLNSCHREALVADGVVRCALHVPGRAWLSDQPNHPSHLLCARHSAASTLTHVRINRDPSLKAAAV